MQLSPKTKVEVAKRAQLSPKTMVEVATVCNGRRKFPKTKVEVPKVCVCNYHGHGNFVVQT